MRPTDCDPCGVYFLGNHLVQEEVLHVLETEGEVAGRRRTDELLQDYHDGGHR